MGFSLSMSTVSFRRHLLCVAATRNDESTPKMSKIDVFNSAALAFTAHPSLSALAGWFYLRKDIQISVCVARFDYNGGWHLCSLQRSVDVGRQRLQRCRPFQYHIRAPDSETEEKLSSPKGRTIWYPSVLPHGLILSSISFLNSRKPADEVKENPIIFDLTAARTR